MRGLPGKTAAARWAALGLGMLLALGGLWALASSSQRTPPEPAPLDDIDPASRERLEDVLRRAEREERGR